MVTSREIRDAIFDLNLDFLKAVATENRPLLRASYPDPSALGYKVEDIYSPLIDLCATARRPDDKQQNVEVEILKFLINNDADVNAKNHRGNSPLYLSVKYRCPRFISTLLKHGADPLAVNNAGETIFHKLVKEPSVFSLHEILDVVVPKVLSINPKFFKENPSFLPPSSNVDMVARQEELLAAVAKHSAHLDGPDVSTAGHGRSVGGGGSAGPSTHPTGGAGSREIRYAISNLDLDFLKAVATENRSLLRDSYPDPVAGQKVGDIHSPLIDLCATARSPDDKQQNVEVEILNFLIDNEADVNAKNHRGNSPLYLSVKYRSPRFISTLLEHGTDLLAVNNAGETIFHKLVKEPSVFSLHEILDVVVPKVLSINPKFFEENPSFLPPSSNVDMVARQGALLATVARHSAHLDGPDVSAAGHGRSVGGGGSAGPSTVHSSF
jgi:hypothetical protein